MIEMKVQLTRCNMTRHFLFFKLQVNIALITLFPMHLHAYIMQRSGLMRWLYANIIKHMTQIHWQQINLTLQVLKKMIPTPLSM